MGTLTRLGMLLVLGFLVTGCAPSRAFLDGHGFYSPKLSQDQVEAAMRAGKVTNLGRFESETSACGNYWAGLADDNLIFPTLEEKLLEFDADAVVNVKATEVLDATMVVYYLATLPMACADWTVSGEAIRVK